MKKMYFCITKNNCRKKSPGITQMDYGKRISCLFIELFMDHYVMKMKTYFINPSQQELVIHEPISTRGITDESILELIDLCRDTVNSGLWNKYK